MGDRANVLIKEDSKDGGVFLYTHCSGSDLPKILQKAIAKKWRWGDSPYLARIIFDQMTELEHGRGNRIWYFHLPSRWRGQNS